ncbi:MAG: hypothetical protein IJW53_02020 [Clostridia bacterium]|nr:hypothetical protein [Clostridia bacterium]
MKVVNIMNFARSYEPRDLETERMLADTTRKQLDLVNEMGVPATFLLQYDVICNDEFVKMIKERAGENIELGFWYEVVEPLTTACGMPYNSKRGWKWDWYINPGFSVAYPLREREVLINEAMRKFREVFGYYPRTVGSWLLDTHTVNYLCDNYEIDAICYCRDQVNTDAYTFVGGYFNQGYYPSRNNYFTPAASEETQINVPVFRLLGPDPIYNYDNGKYKSDEIDRGPYTMEVVYNTGGRNPKIVDWYFDSYYNNESLGFAYMQIGQENSFAAYDIIEPIAMQIEKAKKLDDVIFEKMGDTGLNFKKKYSSTPATAVCALTNWDYSDCQSVIYDSKHYTANIMRVDNKVFIRGLYLFDDRIADVYNTSPCTTFDAVYENMPIVDTYYQRGDTDGGYGIILDESAAPFTAAKTDEEELTVSWNDKSVTFKDNSVIINNCQLNFAYSMVNTKIDVKSDHIMFEYKSHKYRLDVSGADITSEDGVIKITGDRVTLTPSKI